MRISENQIGLDETCSLFLYFMLLGVWNNG